MTFQYNGTVVSSQRPESASVPSKGLNVTQRLGQAPLRILLAAVGVIAFLCFYNRWLLHQVICRTASLILASIVGELMHVRHDRHCAVPERRSPIFAWLVRFIRIELPALALVFADVILQAVVGGMGL